MTSDIAILDQCQRDVESVLFDYSLNKIEGLQKKCLYVVNKLNSLLSSITDEAELLREISIYVLNLYDNFKSEKSVLSMNDKLLWISSKVNGLYMYPVIWKLICTDDLCQYSDELLNLPKSVSVQWGRLNDIATIDWSTLGADELYQNYSLNCSFVSALLSICRNPNIVLTNSISPNKKSSKYTIKFYINGCFRMITLDDQVPLASQSLIVRSLSNESLLWPALLEKLYFKMLKNGYDHQGSNFGVDTYLLTGWLLNYCYINYLTDTKIASLYELFKKGLVLIGIGAGNLTKDESKFYKILPNHDYSIQDIIKQPDGTFNFIAKNPLLETNRVFEIRDLQMFDILYINTNPSMYPFEKKIQFLYRPAPYVTNSSFFAPQFCISNPNAGPIDVKLVLERHLIDNDYEIDSYINVNVYKTNGERIWGGKYLKLYQGAENNTRYHACEFTLAESNCTVIITYRKCNSKLRTFTLRALSDRNFEITKAADIFDKTIEIKSEWDNTNSFGNPLRKEFIKNPQFSLSFESPVSKELDVNIAIFSHMNIPLKLYLFLKDDHDYKFLTKYDANNLVFHNSSYTNGEMIFSNLKLKTNTKYVLVAITDEPVTVKVPFNIVCNYESSHVEGHLVPISTNLGLFNKTLTVPWGDNNKNQILLTLTKRTMLQMRLTCSQNEYADYRSKMRLSIVKLVPNNDSIPILINNEFVDNFYGLFNKILLESGNYLILIERIDQNWGSFKLEIGGDNKFALEST